MPDGTEVSTGRVRSGAAAEGPRGTLEVRHRLKVRHRAGDWLVADTPAALDTLRAIARGERPGLLSLSRPAPVVAFGRRDELSPGFARAALAARDQGFQPWVRKVGGRAAAYHPECVSVDLLVADPDPTTGNQRRYRELGDVFIAALADLGVRAVRGELPEEYCPGEHSVHAVLPSGQRTKLVGTAQRVVSGAWWFSAAVVVARPEPLRAVLSAVYDALDLPLDPTTVGAVTQAAPEVRVEDVEDAVTEHVEGWLSTERRH